VPSAKLEGKMWNFYNTILHRNPIQTEMATSAALWFSGDVLAQYLERRYGGKKKVDAVRDVAPTPKQHRQKHQKEVIQQQSNQHINIDWRRVGIQTLYAGAIWAPFGHYWYKWLDKAAYDLAPPSVSKIRFVGAKLVLEMVLLHPIALFGFFTCVGLMGGDSVREVIEQLRNDFFPSLVIEYLMWTPIDTANFLFIPVKHQLLVVNTMCLFESVMLSYIKANGISLPGYGSEDKKEAKKKERID